MASFVEECVRSFPSTAALAKYRRVKVTSNVLAYAGSTDTEVGTIEVDGFATSDAVNVPVRLRNAEGTALMVASDVIAKDDPCYAAANGKVAPSGTVLIGKALVAAGADGDVIEVLRVGESSAVAAAGGTTAAAFLVDSDSAIPKIELASYVGGTGDYKTTLKPEAALSANNTITVPEANGDVLVAAALAQTLTNKTLSDGCKDTRAAVTINPAADSGAGSSITAGVTQVVVGAVTNDANDWIVLPAIASVGIGHQIRIACNAGGNFEMRTPASSNTTINGQDSDGTKEYLCTDTDVVFVTKATTTGWIAQSLTSLGAVRTAVVPD